MTYFSIHNHSHYSNLRLKDSITFPEQLIEYANEIGLSGISLSDHESLSGIVKFSKAYFKMKEEGKLNDGFKVSYGNEIYLVREDNLEELQENYRNKEKDTQFYHFLLTALNPKGLEQLKILSSKAWQNSFRTGLMYRVPTFKEDMKNVIKGGNVVATSACLGGLIPQYILRWLEAEEDNDDEKTLYYKQELHDFITFCIDVFGQDKFFFEIQPSEDHEQHIVNRKLIELSEVYGVDYIVATDSHFVKKEDRQAHKVYLQSSEGEREVDAFYSSCYIFSEEEIKESMAEHLTEEEIQTALDNTMKIHEMIEIFDLHQETIIPRANIEEFELNHLFEPAYSQFEYIEKFSSSEYEVDRYMLYLIEEGFKKLFQNPELTRKKFYEIMERIDMELKELWLISERLGDRMSSYYVLTREVVLDVIWEKAESICGVARGSAAGFLINHLLEITQINPLDYDLPHFRHLTAERPELPDIDLDSEQSKRMDILQALKDTYGENRVLNIATFSREGSRSALLSACRGMGIDNDEASYLTTLIPSERGRTKSLKECFFGDGKGGKPVIELVNAVNRHEGLMDIALKIEGIIKNNSVHASGIYIFNDDYTKQNAMMKSSTGLETTQFDMSDSDFMGSLKIDCLTVSNIDKIRKTMDYLIEDGRIEWQGSLKKTYDKYLHPRVLEYNDPKMWEMVGANDIPDLFQFDTQVGLQTAQKIEPTNVVELASANNLMRLMGDGIQPVDKYVMFRDNPKLAIQEMEEYGLNNDEMKVIERHLGEASYVSDSQEEIMLLSMDEKIANFSILEANDLRKAVAKIDEEVLKRVKENFFKKGMENGNRENVLKYVWEKQIMPQSGYGFSSLHSGSYSLIALQNMNLASQYPQVYWNTACLTINSGADETSDSDKGGSYGKVAASIGEMQQRGVKIALPDINKANFGFKPNAEENSILFGLRGIVGISDEIVHTIISNRPYTSFSDFLTRLFDTKLIQNTHVLQLIKAGCFDSFDTRMNIMEQYINYTFEPRKQLTMQSFNIVNNLGVIPSEFDLHVRFYNYRQYIITLTHGKSDQRKTKNRLFLLDDIATEFFFEHFTDSCIVDYHDNGNPIVAEWLFDKEYEKLMKPLRDWFTKESTVELVNEALLQEEWETKAKGSVPHWEMSSLSYYYTAHELEGLNEEKYGVVNYNELPQEPVVVREYEYGGRTRQEFQLHRIAGTVLDKDKDRHTVTILTEHGVVTVKLYRNSYSFYDRQISEVVNGKKTVLEAPWFKRGTLLMFTGFRRGNQFVPRVYRDSIYTHTVQKIESIDSKGNLALISERVSV